MSHLERLARRAEAARFHDGEGHRALENQQRRAVARHGAVVKHLRRLKPQIVSSGAPYEGKLRRRVTEHLVRLFLVSLQSFEKHDSDETAWIEASELTLECLLEL